MIYWRISSCSATGQLHWMHSSSRLSRTQSRSAGLAQDVRLPQNPLLRYLTTTISHRWFNGEIVYYWRSGNDLSLHAYSSSSDFLYIFLNWASWSPAVPLLFPDVSHWSWPCRRFFWCYQAVWVEEGGLYWTKWKLVYCGELMCNCVVSFDKDSLLQCIASMIIMWLSCMLDSKTHYAYIIMHPCTHNIYYM